MRSLGADGAALLGRLLMSAIFIWAGFNKAMAPTATMAYMAKLNLPMTGAAYALTVLVELIGGIILLLGYRPRIIALVMAAWCIATGFAAHYHPGDTPQMIHFMKNLAMAGGFLQIVAFGGGRFALTRG